MRVVIFQGQYGIYKRTNLDLSMPSVQTCLGLYALSDHHDYILCAHFDTALGLQHNLEDIKRAIEKKDLSFNGLKATVFGGDGKQSYLRCSPPSSNIGNEIVSFFKRQGGTAEYSPHYYSGLIPRTFNFHYKRGCKITEGQHAQDYAGCSMEAKQLAKQRIRLRPAEYTLSHAKMTDISGYYKSLGF